MVDGSGFLVHGSEFKVQGSGVRRKKERGRRARDGWVRASGREADMLEMPFSSWPTELDPRRARDGHIKCL